MPKRYVAIWFRHLLTDWMVRRRPELKEQAFVLSAPARGRMVVRSANDKALEKGIITGMVVADCRAIQPDLLVLDDMPGQAEKLLTALAEWCIRFTPVTAIDPPDGIILDASGCTHLWGGEQPYLKDVLTRLAGFGYQVRAAIADTVAAGYAVSRYGKTTPIVEPGRQAEALFSLPPAALRLEPATVERLEKLGLSDIRSFISMPRTALRRRFGLDILVKLDRALGREIEVITPVQPAVPYQERLPCPEPIRTATGIEIAITHLLEPLCLRLAKEGKGLRECLLKGYRVDGNVQQIKITTTCPSGSISHLFGLFRTKISQLQPDLGFELFVLQSETVEDMPAGQDTLWQEYKGGDITAVAELLDKIAGKVGNNGIHRYLPAEHYWPERAMKVATSLEEKPDTDWRTDLPRPVHLLTVPEPIGVTVPMPDYPPMLFRHRGQLHRIKKADGPERIEQEWWLQQGLYRDYYCVEDENGGRYWLFRSGDYRNAEPEWFLHGFFA